ncbi:endonuclease/exonuclease/phosphatase family protein [Desulfobulbus alkaliphilus]|uniref:endonuclease/exonuclease/phosphatase family protein n=1 Tax=Desulfobulbus alkaliphilus TaxID=869814 RepID=UPI0019667471|nr:endonuclease/exonuclease/phosphatase family protein [Desulfobulbus alkaliphilus]MBM9537880.1 endonuclease/exonuclease/phosphatase family protein [Desulfobulbus alkaliphilus]
MSYLTAVTYNVHQWVGTDKQYDPGRGLSVLQEIGANIIGLQEVNFPKHSTHRISAGQLAEELGMRLIIGKTLMRQHAAYGNVLLTDRPVDAIRRHDISIEPWEPRGVLDVDLITDSGLIRVLNTHLGLRASERRKQHAFLGDILQSIGNRDMTILMGDFNEWLPIRRPFRKIMASFGHLAAPLTFPTFFPFLALDRILIKPHQRVMATHVHKSRLARVASDHYPVVAALDIH